MRIQIHALSNYLVHFEAWIELKILNYFSWHYLNVLFKYTYCSPCRLLLCFILLSQCFIHFLQLNYLYTDPLRIFNSFNWCHNVTDLGCLPFTKKIGEFPESSIREERPPFEWSLFRSLASLCFSYPLRFRRWCCTRTWNFSWRRKCDKFRRWWRNKYPLSSCYLQRAI